MKWKINYWDMFFGCLILIGVALLGYVMLSYAIAMDAREKEFAKERLEQVKFTTLPSYKIYYKEGKKEVVVCESCVYGQTDDNIYFVSKSGKDTVKVVPKIEVKKVTTMDKNLAK